MNTIRALRQEMGLTQKELAIELNIKQNTLSTWETGRYDPDADMLATLAAYFGTSVDYLLGRSEKKAPTTVSGDGQAQKLERALRDIGVDVDNLSETEIKRIAKLAKTLFEE